jgi:hypothetical protein
MFRVEQGEWKRHDGDRLSEIRRPNSDVPRLFHFAILDEEQPPSEQKKDIVDELAKLAIRIPNGCETVVFIGAEAADAFSGHEKMTIRRERDAVDPEGICEKLILRRFGIRKTSGCSARVERDQGAVRLVLRNEIPNRKERPASDVDLLVKIPDPENRNG